jgi:5-methylcytosine-specific restriction endonuclease McrA
MRYCMKPGCTATTASGWYCAAHKVGRSVVDARKSASARGYDRRWADYSREFLRRFKACAVCGQPSTVTGHFSMSAEAMLARFGRMILEDAHYRPLCRACNAKDKHYNGR